MPYRVVMEVVPRPDDTPEWVWNETNANSIYSNGGKGWTAKLNSSELRASTNLSSFIEYVTFSMSNISPCNLTIYGMLLLIHTSANTLVGTAVDILFP